MKITSQVMSSLARISMSGPWREISEKGSTRLGHLLPENRIVQSYCRHIGMNIERLEGEKSERTAILSTGGRMIAYFDSSKMMYYWMYYFLGNIVGFGEVPTAKLLKQLLREGDVFFDIGANVGFYSFFAAPLCGKTGSVHSFEANPSLIPNLKRSAEINRFPENIFINSAAVSDTHGSEIFLYFPTNKDEIDVSSTYQHDWLNPDSKMPVSTMSIDGYMREKKLARLDVVKIDIEGAELSAFKGMLETFDKIPPLLIVCELMSKAVSFSKEQVLCASSLVPSAKEIIDFLGTWGYEPRHIGKQGQLSRKATIDDLFSEADLVANIAFVHDRLKKKRPEMFSEKSH